MFFTDLGGIDTKNQNHALNDSSFVGKNMFNEKLLFDIDEYASHQQLEAGGSYASTLDGEKQPMKTRSTMIHWMTNEKYKNSLLPIYQQISYIVRKINDSMWGYSYTGYEPFQYSEYKIGDHFDWHIDQNQFTGTEVRKISFSLGLSNKNEYEGGDLIIKSSDQENNYKLDRGDIVVFPSWMLHKVTPITKGKRRVVVGWGEGIIV
jgi:PKHD-type hydroxylase